MSKSLSDFFDNIWGKNEGIVYLPLRAPNNGWKKVFFRWPIHKDKVIEHVLKNTELQYEVYYAPALFRDDVLTGAAPNKYAAIGSRVLWADFDGSAGTPPPQSWVSVGSNGVPEPTITIQTSTARNQHAYWVLEEFVTDIEWIENKNRAIAYTIDSDKGCWDAARLLRPPESVNYGYSKPERKGAKYDVQYTGDTGIARALDDFKDLKNIRLLVEESLLISDTPSVEDIMFDCKWTKNLKSLFTAESVAVGKRSDALVALAMQGAELGWSDNQIYALVLDADTRWSVYLERKDRTRLLTNIVERARRKHPTGLIDLNFAGLLGKKAPVEIEPQVSYTYAEFRALDLHIEWRLENLLSTTGYGIIFGESGLGKTQLGIQLGKCLATGRDFLSWKNVSDPCKVYFFSLELTAPEIEYFTSRQDTDPQWNQAESQDLIDKNFRVAPVGQSISIETPEGKAFFEGELDKFRPDVVFIDSLGALTMGEIEKSVPARQLLDYMQGIRKKFQCAVYVIHHANKGDSSEVPKLKDGYGNTYLFTGTDFVLAMYQVNENIVGLTQAKKRFGPGVGPIKLMRNPHLMYELWEESDVVRAFTKPGPSNNSIRKLLEGS